MNCEIFPRILENFLCLSGLQKSRIVFENADRQRSLPPAGGNLRMEGGSSRDSEKQKANQGKDSMSGKNQ